MGRFIGNLDDFRVFDRVLDESMHLAIHNDGYGDLSLTAVADYNASSESNPIYVNLTFKRYGQDWPVDFNVTRLESFNTGDFLAYGSGANWTLEFNSTVNPGRLSVNILEGAGVEASGLESKPLDLQLGFGRPIVALEHLTAWWDFDEGSGTTVEDYMNGFIGSFSSGDGGVSNVTFDSANAKFGSALRFPTNAWVTTNAYSAQLGIAGGNPRTISFWLFAESGNDGNRGPYGIGQRSCPNSTHRMWGIRGFWNSNFRQFRSQHWCWDPDVWVSEGMRDKWMHIAHLYTGSRVQVYVNGTQRRDWSRDDIDTGSSFPLQFGRWTDENNLGRTFKGLIDDFRVYDAVLTNSEILGLFGGGNGDYQLNAVFEIEPIVDGDPTMGKIRFTRNQEPVMGLDFNLSRDLVMTGGAIDPTSLAYDSIEDVYTFQYSVDPSLTDPAVMELLSPTLFPGLELWLDANDSSFGVDGVGVWRDKSGNGRDATVSMGTPGFNPTGGPGGVLTAIEIRRNGGNDALSIGGSDFFAKEHYYVFRNASESSSDRFDYYGGILGHSTGRDSNYLFENSQAYFHSNQYPEAVSQNGVDLTSGNFAMTDIGSYMILRIQVNGANTGPYGNYRVGTIAEGNAYCVSSDIAEILAFEAVLALDDRAKLEGYWLTNGDWMACCPLVTPIRLAQNLRGFPRM